MFPSLRIIHSRLPLRTTASLSRPFSISRALRKPDSLQQSASPLAPIGVAAALDNTNVPRSKIFDEFALTDRVGIVTGGNRGLGLEMALALSEAGARAIYCFDLPTEPSDEFAKTRAYVERLGTGSKLVYVPADVRDRAGMLERAKEIGDREGRLDVCVAAAGILKKDTNCLEYPAEQFKEVFDVNVNGVLWTAQAAGQQMRRFGNGGSIILMASMSGSITNKDHPWVSYNSSKSAVLQMTRSMACELGREGIRVNSISAAHILTRLLGVFLETQPHLLKTWSNLNPMGRIGRPDELRGVTAWLASDASSFCTGSDIMLTGGYHAW